MSYRSEHPKPQSRRADWVCLNGAWEFAFDFGNSGEARGMTREEAVFPETIEVPFCPESRLSGIGYTDFMPAVWYRRTIHVPKERLSGRVRLHFGAVDHEATVWVNGICVGSHRGGYVSFFLDITDALRAGENRIVVRAADDTRDARIPSGKQSPQYASFSCLYTRTTGIWQTVWLEFLPNTHIQKFHLEPDADTGVLHLSVELCGAAVLTVSAAFDGKPMGTVSAASAGGRLTLALPLAERHLWEVGKGGLYDLTLTYGSDTVESYFGLRNARFDGQRFLLNGRPVFQRLILDQGFYPDGIYTAPSDAELEADIDRAVAMGFNGARLHQKIFEERFLYHADRKGYLVWGEYPSWGLDPCRDDAALCMMTEWLEEIDRDRDHPALIGWCPFNETWKTASPRAHDRLMELIYAVTRAADPTRPCIDTSGYTHARTDVRDVHDYAQDPEVFAAAYASLPEDGTYIDRVDGKRKAADGYPVFVSEYGGIRWSDDPAGWGYGDGPKTAAEFLARLKGLTDAQLDNPCLFGFCYTQLTDVEQEQNGLYTYDRRSKFDPAVIAAIIGRAAAVERED